MDIRPNILAIDDDEAILYTLKAIGDLAGWDILTISRPEQALLTLEPGCFDVIIVDYHMPGMDGLELVMRIRDIDPIVPIVVLTVDERMSLAQRFEEAGATDFAVKPVRAPDLISRLKIHISTGQAARTRLTGQDPLPKGLTQHTMALVLKTLKSAKRADDEWCSAESIASSLGIAYQTVWRYLESLEKEGAVEVRLDYGGRGRPRKWYRLVK